jgi:hypothetical protein
MKLSRNFYLWEFTKSQTAQRLGINNTPPKEAVARLEDLCFWVLQPLREMLDTPIIVSSGYRCEALNKAIGGSEASQHMNGMAADIEAVGISNQNLFDAIQRELRFDQLILEYHQPEKPMSGWVHVSYRDDNRMMAFRIGG